METKSRYEVISEEEKQKRELIRESDELDDKVKGKELQIQRIERQKEDLSTQEKDFSLNEANKLQDLEREKTDFEFKMNNTRTVLDREIADATKDKEYFEGTVKRRKETIEKLITSIDENLKRFGAIAKP